MEVKEGYKQTDLGVIPKDWEVKELQQLCSSINDGTHRTPRYVNEGIPFYSVENVIANNFSETKYITSQEHDELIRRCKPEKGDILLTRIGAIGATKLIDWDVNASIYVSLALLKINNQIDNRYLYWYTKTFQFLKGLERDSLINAIPPKINMGNIGKVRIACPSLREEQTAIANALSDADDLISSLEKLIDKKRHIKQGTMQELLTGKKRLPGYGKDWQVKKLGEIGEITGAGVDKKIKTDEVTVRLINYLDVYHRNFIYSRDLNQYVTAPPAQAKRCKVEKGDIFLTPSSEMPFDIGISSVAMENIPDAAYSYHIIRLRLREDWDLVFRTYIFKTKYFLDQAETFCEGSGKRYVLTLKRFRELTIYYPTDKKEQTTVAQVLFDMDADIEALEMKLSKYRLIKQGIMQELLTGKKRLI